MAQKTERPQNSGGGFADMGDGGCKVAVQVSNSNMETARKHISSIKKKNVWFGFGGYTRCIQAYSWLFS